jgi:hypothetical protein
MLQDCQAAEVSAAFTKALSKGERTVNDDHSGAWDQNGREQGMGGM